MKLTSTLYAASLVAVCSARTFTVHNGCSFTIWPAIFTDLNVGSAKPDFATGWQADPHTSVNFTVPDNWKSGRIWGRRDCDFSDPNPATQCADGGCNGGLLCDPHSGTGVPPATLAEFTLGGGQDNYDVSIVDGFNLPMRIDNNKGCGVPSCPVDLIPHCPKPLKGPLNSAGSPVGCRSACNANLDGHPTNSSNCCSGQYSTPETCPSSGVAYYSYFKGNCPNSYAYAYDESSGTALFTCDSALAADYTITFCPSK